MQYPELATVQARLTYRLTSFLLENLAAGYTVEWMDACLLYTSDAADE